MSRILYSVSLLKSSHPKYSRGTTATIFSTEYTRFAVTVLATLMTVNGVVFFKLEEYQMAKTPLETGTTLAKDSNFTKLIKYCDECVAGRSLAELMKQVFSDLSASKYQMAEYRVQIYGRKMSEWDQ